MFGHQWGPGQQQIWFSCAIMTVIDCIKSRYRKANTNDDPRVDKDIKDEQNKNKESFRQKVKIVLPLLMPDNDFWIKARVTLCFILVLSVRGINFLLPELNKWIVDVLAREK